MYYHQAFPDYEIQPWTLDKEVNIYSFCHQHVGKYKCRGGSGTTPGQWSDGIYLSLGISVDYYLYLQDFPSEWRHFCI